MSTPHTPSPSDPAPPDSTADSTLERAGAHEFAHTLHEAEGDLRIRHHFAGLSQLPVGVQTWILSPGAREGMPAHADPALEEIYLVLSGQARIRQDGAEHLLGPGDALRAPIGIAHDLACEGDEELRLLVVWGPPGVFDMSGFRSYRKAIAARDAVNRDAVRIRG
ncbi:cupin domain-containing protein [Brachybacterium aquaticum]|uniref:Putative cupin superfamily protein n=1 Tax=Brachybacterium aquaticum TaxID=1432564 RepID=A0A841AD30_9MICO|nr:cupin domain-containing protein [Brachybacterium aquaticum]MBB5833189.1 putative cupin superfamily protein [Brachybacterium aquaticum]